MNVVLSAEAEADLEAIGDYIARDNPGRAATFVSALIAKCDALAEMPLAFPMVERYATSGIRRRPYRDYLIFYRVEEVRIVVLHILHGARDYDRILSDQR